MSRREPERNPFPAAATLSLEGVSFGDGAEGWRGLPSTYPLPPLVELRSRVDAYLDRWPTRRWIAEPSGRCFMLAGDHGTGKTHAVADLMRRVKAHRRDGPRPLLLYVKALVPSFVEAYSRLAERVTVEQLQELGRHALVNLARERGGGRLPPAGPRSKKEMPAPAGNAELATFLNDPRIPEADLWSDLARRLSPAAERRDHFARAFEYLFWFVRGREEELCRAAHRWFTRQPVADTDLRRLGVQGPIDQPDEARAAVQFFAALCNLANTQIVVAFDQCEGLVGPADTSADARQSLQMFHSLLEVVPDNGGLVLLAGTPRSYEVMAADLKDRIPQVVTFDRISPDEFRWVLKVYLDSARPAGGAAPGEGGPRADAEAGPVSDDDIYPFDESAVRRLLEKSGGTLRRLLQGSEQAFDAWWKRRERQPEGDPPRIDAAMINDLPERPREAVDRPAVQKAVGDWLQGRNALFRLYRGESVQFGYALEGREFPFALVDRDGSPRALFLVSVSAFIVDEALAALRVAETAQALRALPNPPRLVVVFAGYASPEVLQKLGDVPTVQPIVYDPETFDERMAKILGLLPGRAEGPAAAPGTADPFAAPVAALESLSEVRAEASALLQQGLNQQSREIVVGRHADRLRRARVEWAGEREQAEGKIREARADRFGGEFAQFLEHQKRAEADHRRLLNRTSLRYVLGSALLAVLFVALGGYSLSNRATLTSRLTRDVTRLKGVTKDYLDLGPETTATNTPGPVVPAVLNSRPDLEEIIVRATDLTPRRFLVVPRTLASGQLRYTAAPLKCPPYLKEVIDKFNFEGPRPTREFEAELNEAAGDIARRANSLSPDSRELLAKLDPLDERQPGVAASASGSLAKRDSLVRSDRLEALIETAELIDRAGFWSSLGFSCAAGFLVLGVGLGLLVREYRAHLFRGSWGLELGSAGSFEELDRGARRVLARVLPGPGDRADPPSESVFGSGGPLFTVVRRLRRSLGVPEPVGSPGWALEHPNPVVRYVTALALADRDRLGGISECLVEALVTGFGHEGTAAVRRVQAVALARRAAPSFLTPTRLDSLFRKHFEAAYLVEELAQSGPSPGPSDLPPPLSYVALVSAPAAGDRADSKILYDLLGRSLAATRLVEWYRSAKEPGSFGFLDDLPARRLSQAARAVSPLDPGGLGTLDRLRNVERFDEIYLFLREAQFYKAQDILLLATDDVAPAAP